MYPTLSRVTVNEDSPPALLGIAECIDLHGDSEVAVGLQHILAVVIELLGRLIGEPLAMKILERPNGQ